MRRPARLQRLLSVLDFYKKSQTIGDSGTERTRFGTCRPVYNNNPLATPCRGGQNESGSGRVSRLSAARRKRVRVMPTVARTGRTAIKIMIIHRNNKCVSHSQKPQEAGSRGSRRRRCLSSAPGCPRASSRGGLWLEQIGDGLAEKVAVGRGTEISEVAERHQA